LLNQDFILLKLSFKFLLLNSDKVKLDIFIKIKKNKKIINKKK